MQDSNWECLWNTFPSRLNAHWQTNWAVDDQGKNLNSTARPYDLQVSSPLKPTAIWHSHLALAICMFVVANFNALAQASSLPLLNARFDPIMVSDTKSPADWMSIDKLTELSKVKLKTWTRQPVLMISEHSYIHAWCMHTYIPTYIPTYIHTFLFGDLHWHREHFYWWFLHEYAAMVLRVNSEMVIF